MRGSGGKKELETDNYRMTFEAFAMSMFEFVDYWAAVRTVFVLAALISHLFTACILSFLGSIRDGISAASAWHLQMHRQHRAARNGNRQWAMEAANLRRPHGAVQLQTQTLETDKL